MHGGKGSGAPRGNRNALKHGKFTGEQLARNAQVREGMSRILFVLNGWQGA